MGLDLSGTQLVLLAAAGATGATWLAAAGAVFLARRPPEPPVGPRTLELGPERPAVANFLVHDFRVTDDAVPATLIDLAARNVVDIEERGPGVFYVRLRASSDEVLTRYEQRVLEHLRGLASGGVVPAGALTTGPHEESRRWRRGFVSEVVDDAKTRGLCRDVVDGRVFAVLAAAAAIPALLAWAVFELAPGLLLFAGAGAILGWIRARHPQRETPAGLDAASRWLGVRAALQEDAEFARQSPLSVELWSRLLAYGAALGVAAGSSRPLPMGEESDTSAWSASGGRWRSVRIGYPRYWPPLWGKDPIFALLVAAAVVVGAGAFLYYVGPLLPDADRTGLVFFVAVCTLFVLGVAVFVMAASDFRSSAEVTGPIIRLRAFGDEDDRRYYLAVDDGDSREVRALRVSESQYARVEQGERVTVRYTPNLGCVRWIVSAPDGN